MTSDDRTLLELAAKAAGWSGHQSEHGYWSVTAPDGRQYVACEFGDDPTFADALCECNWSPLLDDGDEARLEAVLGLDVEWHMPFGRVIVGNGECCAEELFSDHNGDRQAARRLAGVRAAAEIGRSMKEPGARTQAQGPHA